MENYTLVDGFPKGFHPPIGSFTLRYSDTALEVAKNLGLDMSYLPLQLNTRRAELVEVVRAAIPGHQASLALQNTLIIELSIAVETMYAPT